MKTISLIYGYSARNAGDFAISLGAIDVLLSLGFHIKLFSRYKQTQRDFEESYTYLRDRYKAQIEVYESPFYLDRSSDLLSAVIHYAEGAAIVSGLKKNEQFCKLLLDSDIVIFNGGNLLRCNSYIDFTRLCALMYPLKVAKKGKVPYLLFPQSASRINSIGRKMLFPLIKGARTVFIREGESFDYINKLMPCRNYVQTIDLAFFIDKKGLLTVKRKKMIAITLRFHTVGDIAYLSESEQNEICQRMEKYVETYKPEYEFAVIVQTDKDFDKSQEFANKLGLPLIKSNDPVQLLSIYQRACLLIGMRLHSIILALSVGTPCFGLFYSQWGLKNPGLMNYFGMPYKIIDRNDNIEPEEMSIRRLLIDTDYYSSKLKEKIELEYKNFKERLAALCHKIDNQDRL